MFTWAGVSKNSFITRTILLANFVLGGIRLRKPIAVVGQKEPKTPEWGAEITALHGTRKTRAAFGASNHAHGHPRSRQTAMGSARATISQQDYYHQTIAAGRAAIATLRAEVRGNRLALRDKIALWLDRTERELDSMPATVSDLIGEMKLQRGTEFDASSYGL